MEIISGKKITLRKIEYTDTDDIVRWRNKDFVRSNFIFQQLFTNEIHENWMKTRVDTGEVVQFIISEIQTGKGVGSVYLRDIDRINQKAEYGIFIGEEDALGKGFGSEAAALAIKYAFEQLGLHKVFLRVFADNLRAIKSYENGGFVKEACFKHDVKIDGKYYDMVFMAIINEKDD